jgi:hypothetical protein
MRRVSVRLRTRAAIRHDDGRDARGGTGIFSGYDRHAPADDDRDDP